MGRRHAFPTRAFAIDFIRTYGAKAFYGPKHPETNAEALRRLRASSDAQYMSDCGCDHHDAAGHCLGHERVSA